MIISAKNISDMFCKFWEKANRLDSEERKLLWKEIYEEPNKEIFEHLESIYKTVNKDYNVDNSLDRCFHKYESVFHRINLISGTIENDIYKVCKSCSEVFNIDNLNLNFITMVGQFNANAFVTPYNVSTAFYFIEQMPEKRYIDILLAHEITHLFHFSQLIGKEFKSTLAERIFIDGLACFTSSVICPSFTKAEYLSFDSISEEWLLSCKKNLPGIKSEIISNIENSEHSYFIKYFSNSSDNEGEIPKRIGYFIGFTVISYLTKFYSLDELILWGSDKIIKEVKEAMLNII